MTTYGLHELGFTPKTLIVVRDQLNAALRATFGSSIDLTDKAVFGQFVGILSEHFASLWELAEATNSSQDPDKAAGAALDALCLLTGTVRPPATYSAVTVTLTGTPTTIVPAGNVVSADSTEVQFATSENATITAVNAWVTLTAYVVGDRVTNAGNVYECTVAGTSSAADPDTTDETIVDVTLTWTYVGAGTGAIDVTAVATETGPVEAFARDLTTIVNQISGWESVINLADANLGRDVATDSELRLLREQELATGGSSPINALRAELLNVVDVVAATIFVNYTDYTDVDGVPPHSIEAMVRGPASPTAAFDQSIWDALLAGVAAGIRTHGDEVGTATDDEGTEHVMKFSRPEEVPIWVEITVLKDPDEYPVDGDDQIKEAIVEWGDLQNSGKNAVASRIAAAAFEVPGVLDVVTCYIDDVIAPIGTTTVAISLRQIATYDTSRIGVTSSDGVP